MSARKNILARIRAANKSAMGADAEREDPIERINTLPRSPLPDVSWDALEHFKKRSLASASSIDCVAGLDEVPSAVNKYLSSNQLPSEIVGWSEFKELGWDECDLTFQSRFAVGDDKVGMTGSFCAVAETGTLVLLSSTSNHATTSLLPETHIAVVRSSRIVKTMEDAWHLIREETGELPRQVNFISGPSRTADIEMTLVYGAHGPFRVHVIILDE